MKYTHKTLFSFLITICCFTAPAFAQKNFLPSSPFTNSLAEASSPELVTSGAPSGSLRNNFPGAVGFRFATDTNGMTVTHLGRWVFSGNSGTHTVRLLNATGVVASVSINTSGASVGWNYVSITPVALPGSTTYILSTEETSGGDQWGESAAITTTSEAGSVFSAFSGLPLDFAFYADASANQSYGGVNLKYQ